MKYDNRVYLEHIAECIRRVENNMAGGRDAFMGSETLQDATLRNLQVMAESTQRLAEPLKASHTQADWKGLSGVHNVLTHGYLDIRLERVWTVLEQDLPTLRPRSRSCCAGHGMSLSSHSAPGWTQLRISACA
jgi:uncharacterized protein with HEPN domain